MGLTLVLDYNEERQNYKIIEKNEPNLMKRFYRNNADVSIYLDTISLLIFQKVLFYFYILDPVGLFGEGQYNLNNIKEISVTDSFMELDKDFRKCQNVETYDSCQTRLYIENLRLKCGCIPFSLKVSAKVN